jgi:hypothetical protein
LAKRSGARDQGKYSFLHTAPPLFFIFFELTLLLFQEALAR